MGLLYLIIPSNENVNHLNDDKSKKDKLTDCPDLKCDGSQLVILVELLKNLLIVKFL